MIWMKRPTPLATGLICLIAAMLIALAPRMAGAQALDLRSNSAILLDLSADSVLLAKNDEMPIPPASMSKLMTIAVAFEAIEQGRLTLETQVPVSERAFRKEGSTMFLNLGDRVRVEDLLRGIIIQSGNDACIALAEGLSGSEAAFVDEMNALAEHLGLEQSHFANVTGLPHPEHRMSVRDLATLARHLIEAFPQHYHYFSEREFTWATARQPNRNPLLYIDGLNADGLKTGHTEEAGYGLVGSAQRDGRRLVAVVSGLSSIAERSQESERLITWGFRNFSVETLLSAGDEVGQADVWIGEQAQVPLVLEKDLRLALPKAGRKQPQARLVYEGPVPAPIQKGDRIGILVVRVPDLGETRVPVLAGADVARGGYLAKAKAGAMLLTQKAKAALGIGAKDAPNP
ncbi:MAG: D-alanyl-D-alanine carboxypeptidase [Neomegalonema sp.]|nr:D-alanyl-D-alanine carboxypeptidase [Neomegalonema sp.]